MKSLSSFFNLLPQNVIFAHCDIPCGIYSPKSAQLAAATVLKMVQKIKEEPEPEIESDESAIKYTNSVVRYINVKEEHAQICKKELLILWTDYFKEEHLEKFPNLHEKFWKTAKLCSKNKQAVDENLAQELVKVVDELAEIFEKSKHSS